MQRRTLSQRWAYYLVYYLTHAMRFKTEGQYLRSAVLARAEMEMNLALEAVANRQNANG